MRTGSLRRVPWLLVTLWCAACGADHRETVDELLVADVQAEIDALIEAGLESEVAPPMAKDTLLEYELRLERRQLADDMSEAVRSAMAPIALAAAIFAPEGAADLLLAIMPVHKIAKAAKVARDAMRLRSRDKKSRRLIKLHDEFRKLLPGDADEFVRLASRLKRAERRALRKIHKHTGSARVVQALLRKHVENHANVVWIGRKLDEKAFDKDFVRRFTFDADLVEDYTLHDAHLSWRVLEDVVEKRAVADKSRASLASKVAGMMGERTAMKIVRSDDFTRRYFQRDDALLASGRGMGYRKHFEYDKRGSIDIVASDPDGRAVFVEVKNYAAETWGKRKQRNEVLKQLERHDEGIEQVMYAGDELRATKDKVLLVTREGFMGWDDELKRRQFTQAVSGRGWTLEFMPADDIAGFDELIDILR